MYPACSRSAIRGSGFVYHMYRAVVAARHSSYIHLSSPPPPPHTSPPTPPHRRLLPYPPPCTCQIGSLFYSIYSSFMWNCVLYSPGSLFFIYTLHTLTHVSYIFFSQSSSVSIKTATVGGPRALSVPLHIGHLFTVAYLAKK